jgi:hypothetical protein
MHSMKNHGFTTWRLKSAKTADCRLTFTAERHFSGFSQTMQSIVIIANSSSINSNKYFSSLAINNNNNNNYTFK